jgi:integrase
MQAITLHDVEAYGRARRAMGVSGATVNREFAALGRMFTKAGLPSPVSRAVFYPEAPGRTRFLSAEERARLEQVMDPAAWRIVELAIETGMRRGELFHLAWAEVDLTNAIVTVPRAKSGRTRFVYLSARAIELLQSLPSRGRSPWVFPNAHGTGPIAATNWIRRVFVPALREAGIENFRFHDLRHTFASRLAAAGVQQAFLQELLGHASPAMSRRYTHLTAAHLLDAVNRPGQKAP